MGNFAAERAHYPNSFRHGGRELNIGSGGSPSLPVPMYDGTNVSVVRDLKFKKRIKKKDSSSPLS